MTDQPSPDTVDAPLDAPRDARADVLSSDEATEPARRSRARHPDSVLRWATAGVVLVATAAAAAAVVTAVPRDRLPGLAAPNDGRYDFAPLSLPPLPSGRPVPSAKSADGRHFAALPDLLLPPPKQAPGAAPAAAAGCADYAELHATSAHVPTVLATDACRAAASRTWTAEDGTRTEIWLLRFGSRDESRLCFGSLGTAGAINRVPNASTGTGDFALGPDQQSYSLAGAAEAGGPAGSRAGRPTGRVAYLLAGDVVVTVVMTNAAGVPDQAFHQVVTLQSELLS
ncbi:hypothetical protein [Kitasatospora viridis]|uniref:Uncharacterized protein n=1 Tax=Kitasatospora viridis TaxID=281105 RepID=A0A561UGZ9_9ACTN|nr:hypothetical protein [Kitasatospora viridis]TWF98640.1 hypothetical protein FHX73_112461 [Kitasatospora viridis]